MDAPKVTVKAEIDMGSLIVRGDVEIPDTIKEFQRIDAQYEIILLLRNALYHACLDDEEAHNEARSLSYKILEILKKHEAKECSLRK